MAEEEEGMQPQEDSRGGGMTLISVSAGCLCSAAADGDVSV